MVTTDIKRLAATGILAFALGSWAVPALAVVPLEGRTLTGDRVDAYDSNAVMIYDPNADLTWLRDWNVNGAKPWANQLAWATSLSVGAFANWSLPSALNQDGSGPCRGYNCTGSQMGYLWNEVLGNTPGSSRNPGPFLNEQSNFYWSGTEYAPDPEWGAWGLYTYDGGQWYGGKIGQLYAVAVRPGDVAPPVPEPQTWAMLLLGLGAVAVASKRRPG